MRLFDEVMNGLIQHGPFVIEVGRGLLEHHGQGHVGSLADDVGGVEQHGLEDGDHLRQRLGMAGDA